MPRHVCFLSMDDLSEFVSYDRLAVEPLSELGFGVQEVSWRSANVPWRDFDAVIVRSTWDYQRSVKRFLEVLADIERQGVPLANPSGVCAWNARKRYLLELARLGVPVVPTVMFEAVDSDGFVRGLLAAAERFATGRLVVKPEVSANADDTYRVEVSESGELRVSVRDDTPFSIDDVASRFAGRSHLVQPFMATVLSRGEYSLFYFSGSYSHAVAKRPATSDFRVQEEHGSSIDALVASDAMKAVAEQSLSAARSATGCGPFLYARVDLVEPQVGTFVLMELELIEPSLYFQYDPRSPARFADAIAAWLASRARSGSDSQTAAGS